MRTSSGARKACLEKGKRKNVNERRGRVWRKGGIGGLFDGFHLGNSFLRFLLHTHPKMSSHVVVLSSPHDIHRYFTIAPRTPQHFHLQHTFIIAVFCFYFFAQRMYSHIPLRVLSFTSPNIYIRSLGVRKSCTALRAAIY